MEAGGIKNEQKNIIWRAHLNPCTLPAAGWLLQGLDGFETCRDGQ